MDKRTEFVDSLKVDVPNEEELLKNLLDKKYEEYAKIYENKNVQDYFHYVIAAIMLSQHQRYEDFTVEIPYRFKAPKSIKDKLEDYASRTSISYDTNTNEPKIDLKNINDIFAMKIIACNRPPTFYSNDPEIQELIEEKKKNHRILGEMQELDRKSTRLNSSHDRQSRMPSSA